MKAMHQNRNRLPAAVIIFSVITLMLPTRAATSIQIASGFARPLYAVSPPGDAEHLFILEQHAGRIRILNLLTRQVNAADFLQIGGLATGNEQGLLGLAFDPNYVSNGYFYVNVTVAGTGNTEIRRYKRSVADPDIADDASEMLILSWAQPQSNHNGGWMDFGPDGFLYISSGDGGGGNDDDAGHTPGLGNAQDTSVLLGKLLRIDITGDDFPADPDRNYRIPPDNPLVGQPGAAEEIWAFGLRNPWRPSFDRLTGDLYIADVGQGAVEEVNFQPAASAGGENYGWRVMEGDQCNFPNDPLPCGDPNFTNPIHLYNHVGAPDGGQSVTGGYVYRGPQPNLQGMYFFADFLSHQVWTFEYDGSTKTNITNRTAELTPDAGDLDFIASFGEDGLGNLYIVDLIDGEIFKILAAPPVDGDFDGDGFVNLVDFGFLSKLWQSVNCGYCGGFDTDDDKDVDLTDLSTFSAAWLQ